MDSILTITELVILEGAGRGGGYFQNPNYVGVVKQVSNELVLHFPRRSPSLGVVYYLYGVHASPRYSEFPFILKEAHLQKGFQIFVVILHALT